MDIFERSKENLNLRIYKDADNQLFQMGSMSEGEIAIPDDQYILRMMIKSPWSEGFKIPKKLQWLAQKIEFLHTYQQIMFGDHPFVYVTVRSGEVKSVTDDMWHVDGFSMRVAHRPEQNYIWSNCYPTEVLNQQFSIPNDFDPFKHNLHTFLQDNADEKNIYTLKEKHICCIDPYVVHRRPQIPVGTKRGFFRISFVPVEIEDDSCTQNPLLPIKKYGRDDVRKLLIPYDSDLQNA